MAGLRQKAARAGAGTDLVFLQPRVERMCPLCGVGAERKNLLEKLGCQHRSYLTPGALHSRLTASVLGTVALPRSKRKEISCRLLRNPAPAVRALGPRKAVAPPPAQAKWSNAVKPQGSAFPCASISRRPVVFSMQPMRVAGVPASSAAVCTAARADTGAVKASS